MSVTLQLEASPYSFDAIQVRAINWLEDQVGPTGYVGGFGRQAPDRYVVTAWTKDHMPGESAGKAIVYVTVREASAKECERCLQPVTLLERMTSMQRQTIRMCDTCREITAVYKINNV